MSFEGESLTIGGREYTGSVFIETEVSNASFDFEQGDVHGTHHEIDIVHYAECFVAGGVTNTLAMELDDEARKGRVIEAWLAANLRRVESRFDMEVKTGRLHV